MRPGLRVRVDVVSVRPVGGVQLAVAGLLDDGNGPRPLETIGAELGLWAYGAVVHAVRAGLTGGWLEQIEQDGRPAVGLVPFDRRRRDLYALLAQPGACLSPGQVDAAVLLGVLPG